MTRVTNLFRASSSRLRDTYSPVTISRWKKGAFQSTNILRENSCLEIKIVLFRKFFSKTTKDKDFHFFSHPFNDIGKEGQPLQSPYIERLRSREIAKSACGQKRALDVALTAL